MARSRMRTTGRRERGRFAGIPHIVMDHPCFVSLSAKAVRLLLEFARQYNGHNNGDLCAAWRLMRDRGWVSRDTLNQALRELLDHGLVLLSRQGGKHKASLYALTWVAVDECRGKLDIAATHTPPGDWQHWKEQFSKPGSRVNVTRQSGQSRARASVSSKDWTAGRVSQSKTEHAIDPPDVDLSKLPGAWGLPVRQHEP